MRREIVKKIVILFLISILIEIFIFNMRCFQSMVYKETILCDSHMLKIEGGHVLANGDLKLDDGTVINCILGDVKADKDTDLNNIVTTHNGCCSEFIVDPKVIPDNVKITGNISNLYDNWSSPVHSVIMYDRYTEIPTETQ